MIEVVVFFSLRFLLSVVALVIFPIKKKSSESNIHILTRVGAGTDEIFNNAMETVQEWLDQGPEQLALAITALIHAQRYNYEPD